MDDLPVGAQVFGWFLAGAISGTLISLVAGDELPAALLFGLALGVGASLAILLFRIATGRGPTG